MGLTRRMILPIVYRLTGKRYPALEREMEKMGPEAMRELHLLLREVEQVLEREKRIVRPFPGGPRMRM